MLTGTINQPDVTSRQSTTVVENQSSEDYFCFEEKHDEIALIEWRTLVSEAPVAQWTSVLDF